MKAAPWLLHKHGFYGMCNCRPKSDGSGGLCYSLSFSFVESHTPFISLLAAGAVHFYIYVRRARGLQEGRSTLQHYITHLSDVMVMFLYAISCNTLIKHGHGCQCLSRYVNDVVFFNYYIVISSFAKVKHAHQAQSQTAALM